MAKKSPATNAASGKRVKKSTSLKTGAGKAAVSKSASGKPPKAVKTTKPAQSAAPATPSRKTRRPVTEQPSAQMDRKGKGKKKVKPQTVTSTIQPPSPAGVGTSESPKKNQAGLSRKDLEFFRNLLLEKRREIVGDMSSMEREALGSTSSSNLSNLPVHMADMGTDNYEQEFTLGLVEKDRVLLREINTALAKIQNGTYGLCEATGKPIGKPRLEAKPWAKHCIEYTRKLEQGRR